MNSCWEGERTREPQYIGQTSARGYARPPSLLSATGIKLQCVSPLDEFSDFERVPEESDICFRKRGVNLVTLSISIG